MKGPKWSAIRDVPSGENKPSSIRLFLTGGMLRECGNNRAIGFVEIPTSLTLERLFATSFRFGMHLDCVEGGEERALLPAETKSSPGPFKRLLFLPRS